MQNSQKEREQIPGFTLTRAFRTAIGGMFMGMANLIPGVSGGTMILAIGLYEEFIDTVADLTALRITRRRVIFMVILCAFAGMSIVGLSSLILKLLLWHTSLMFALFIGLTLGGAPLLLKMIGKLNTSVVVAALIGVLLMALVAKCQAGASMPRNTGMDFVSGIAGATTMVLPGISGSYVLLILDQYDRVIGAVSDLKHGSWDALKIIIPVGIGAVIGIVGLSNLLKVLLHRYEKVTLGFLLGVLLGSVLGLWPFGRVPKDNILEKGTDIQLQQFAQAKGIAGAESLEGETLRQHIVDRWETRTAPDYTTQEVVWAVIALGAGMFVTVVLGRFGAKSEAGPEPETQAG